MNDNIKGHKINQNITLESYMQKKLHKHISKAVSNRNYEVD